MVWSYWRGWRIILFEDRGAPHSAEESLETAANLGIELRFLPRAAPELNAMDHLWRFVKGRALADRSTRSVDESADAACRYLLAMSPQKRMKKAGVLSNNFWLTNRLHCQRSIFFLFNGNLIHPATVLAQPVRDIGSSIIELFFSNFCSNISDTTQLTSDPSPGFIIINLSLSFFGRVSSSRMS
jgi:transposase